MSGGRAVRRAFRSVITSDHGRPAPLVPQTGTPPQPDRERGSRCAARKGITSDFEEADMATIRKEIVVDVPPAEVWDALRDFGHLHERLATGFVTDVELQGDVRAVTFFNGAVFHERFISEDADARRLAWTIIDGPWEHHSGSAEVRELREGQSCFVWLTDLLPDEMAAETEDMVAKGAAAIKETLEHQKVR
jgi:uncharacterized protein YndB with AHSA1/START domain